MFLTILDLVLLIILFIFVAFGFALGLIQTIGALIGVVIGGWLAGVYYEPVGSWLEPILLGNMVTARIIAFILVFTFFNRLIGLAFWFINKIFNLISIIPFTKSLNRLLGSLLGFLEGTLAIGIVLYFISQITISDWLVNAIASSPIALWFIGMANFLSPIVPAIFSKVSPMI